MNKPTLNVLGRKHNIVSVEVEVAPGETKNFYDGEYHDLMPADVSADFAQAIENPSKAQHFIQRLEKTIDESVEYLIQLKLQIADNVLENRDMPFVDIGIKHLIEEVTGQVSFIEGLESAMEIAKGNVNVEVSSTDE